MALNKAHAFYKQPFRYFLKASEPRILMILRRLYAMNIKPTSALGQWIAPGIRGKGLFDFGLVPG